MNGRWTLLLGGWAGVLLCSAPATAQESGDNDDEDPIALDAVEVESGSWAGREQALRAMESGSVRVMELDEQGDQPDLATILRRAPGVQVQSRGGLGQSAQLSVRGSDGDQVLIYLDGIPLNRASGGAVNVAELPLGQLERVEIFPGLTASYLLGSPVGGAVNLVTRTPEEPWQVQGLMSVGSYGTRRLMVSGAMQGEQTGGWVSVDHRSSQGDFPFLDDNGTPFNTDDDQETTRRNNAFDQIALHGRLNHQLSGGETLVLDMDSVTSERGIPNIDNNQSEEASLSTARVLGNVRLSTPHLLGSPQWSGSLRLGLLQQTEHYADRLAEVGLGRRVVRGETVAMDLQAQVEGWMAQDRVLLLVLVSPSMEQYRQSSYIPEPENYPASHRLLLRTALNGDIDLYDGRFWLTPQLRVEAARDSFEGQIGFANNTTPEVEETRVVVSPSLGMRGEVVPGGWLRGAIYRGTRLPTFYELFGDRGFIIGNP
ncbi:MAG: TonB-dependent receptor plug domain-containing protein, partial [Myxococcota bacterium]